MRYGCMVDFPDAAAREGLKLIMSSQLKPDEDPVKWHRSFRVAEHNEVFATWL